jgi:S-adenosylmethionine/arginine decarboxylase-like enzyme
MSPPVGNQVTKVFHHVAERFFKLEEMERLVFEALAAENFTICGKVAKKFTPKGFTLLVLLAESHLAVHTYIEYGSIYVELYSCRGTEDGLRTMQIIGQALEASRTLVDDRISVPVEAAGDS